MKVSKSLYVSIFLVLGSVSCWNYQEQNKSLVQKSDSLNSNHDAINDDICWEALIDYEVNMDNQNYDEAIKCNNTYSLSCKQDTLMWLSTHLNIVRAYYGEVDSIVHYLHLIKNRSDYQDLWSENELLLSLALTYDSYNQHDSACFYFDLLKMKGGVELIRSDFPERLNYCE